LSTVPCTKTLTPVPRLDDLVERDREHDCEGFGVHHICVKVVAVADLPTRFGGFRIVAFWNNRDGKEHLALEQYGIRVSGRVPHVISANEHNRFYLQTKATRSGHLIDVSGKPPATEQDDPVLVAAEPTGGGPSVW
jgi:hypothetical protein